MITYFNFNQGVSGGNNTSITSLINTANPSQNGIFIGFQLMSGISNFIIVECRKNDSNSNWRLDNTERRASFYIYPNPASDFTNFIFDSNLEYDINIYDILGNSVYTNKQKSGSKIDVSTWKNGTYFISIVSHDNILDTQKLIINH